MFESQPYHVEFAPQAELVVTSRDGTTTVAVTGEIDLAVADRLSDQLSIELGLTPRALIIDLGAVTFCSSSGLAILVSADAQAREEGIACVVATDQRAVVRPLRMLALDQVLCLCPTVAEAHRVVTKRLGLPWPRVPRSGGTGAAMQEDNVRDGA